MANGAYPHPVTNPRVFRKSLKYIHYFAVNLSAETKEALSWINTMSEAKTSVLTKSLRAYWGRLGSARKLFRKAGMNSDKVEELFSGKAFAALGDVRPNDVRGDDGDDSLQGSVAKLRKVPKQASDVGKFLELAERNVLDFLNSSQADKMLESYTALILEDYAESQEMSRGDIANSIIQSLISKSGGKFFTVFGKSSDLPPNIVRMMALVTALPDADMEAVASRYKGNSDIIRVLIQKYNGWVAYLNKTARQAGKAIGRIKAHKGVLEQVDKLNMRIMVSDGSKRAAYTRKFHPDVEMRNELGRLSGLLSDMQQTKGTSRVTLAYDGQNGVTATMGVTIQEGRKRIDPKIRTYSFPLYNTTSLLNMLVREAGLSTDSMYALFNILAAHNDLGIDDKSDEQPSPQGRWVEDMWKGAVESLKWMTLLDSLQGLNIPDRSYFISINGNLWTMGDFIRHILDSHSSVSWREAVGKVGNDFRSGLDRQTYMNVNAWQGSARHNLTDALRRSDSLHTEMLRIMSATKIHVSLTLRELGLLFKLKI